MRKRGFTLIEVIIALAIFVVGALAIVRIFPPALGVVQNSGYSTIATRLSDSILSQMKNEGGMPEATLDINQSTLTGAVVPLEASWQDQAGSVIGTSHLNYSLPTGPTDSAYNASALNHYGFIRGEKHDVKVVYDASGNPIDSYILTDFPYVQNIGVRLYIKLPISGVTIDANGQLNFSNSTYVDPVTGNTATFSGGNSRPLNTIPIQLQSAGVTYLSARSIIPAGVNAVDSGTRYYVSYQWGYAGSTHFNSVVDEPLSLPDDTLWPGSAPDSNYVMHVLQGAIKVDGGSPVILAGPVKVTLRLTLSLYDSTAGEMSTFPNTFPAAQDPNTYSTADNANRGYVPIIPASSGSVFTPNVPIYADYEVSDWRALVDQDVTGNTGNVILPVSLLNPNASVLGLGFDVNDQNLPTIVSSSSVNVKNGQVTYNTVTFPLPIPTPRIIYPVRTVYQGLDGWARQISATAESYVPYVNTSGLTNTPNYRISYVTGAPTTASSYNSANAQKYFLPREPWREYYWPGGSYIYFHPSDAGKMVNVSYTVAGDTTIYQSHMTIDNTIINIPSANQDFAPTGKVVALSLKDSNGNLITADTLLGVRGVSITARTAWLNGKTYQQSVVTGYRVANAD